MGYRHDEEWWMGGCGWDATVCLNWNLKIHRRFSHLLKMERTVWKVWKASPFPTRRLPGFQGSIFNLGIAGTFLALCYRSFFFHHSTTQSWTKSSKNLLTRLGFFFACLLGLVGGAWLHRCVACWDFPKRHGPTGKIIISGHVRSRWKLRDRCKNVNGNYSNARTSTHRNGGCHLEHVKEEKNSKTVMSSFRQQFPLRVPRWQQKSKCPGIKRRLHAQ